MNISPKAVEMVKHHEGVRFKPYRCPAKLWTIGVGHVLYPDQGKMPVDQRDGYQLRPEDNRIFSAEEVNAILRNDIARFEPHPFMMLDHLHSFGADVHFLNA
jgi:GH24 family phage-related lysozyme (muramidase)